VLFEADAERNGDVCQAFGVYGFPDFRIVDRDGNAIDFGENGEANIVLAARRPDGPRGVADRLLTFASGYFAEHPDKPTDPVTVAALCELLDIQARNSDADALLDAALEANDLSEEQYSGLLIVRALRKRVAGDLAGGLADLQEALPNLTVADAEPAKGTVGPFRIASGAQALGVVSSSLDAATATNALLFADAHAAALPDPADTDADLQVPFLAYAVAIGDWTAAQALTSAVEPRSDLTGDEHALAVYLSGLTLLRTDADKAYTYLNYAGLTTSGQPFALDALLAAKGHAEEVGNAEVAGSLDSAISSVFASRTPPRLALSVE